VVHGHGAVIGRLVVAPLGRHDLQRRVPVHIGRAKAARFDGGLVVEVIAPDGFRGGEGPRPLIGVPHDLVVIGAAHHHVQRAVAVDVREGDGARVPDILVVNVDLRKLLVAVVAVEQDRAIVLGDGHEVLVPVIAEVGGGEVAHIVGVAAVRDVGADVEVAPALVDVVAEDVVAAAAFTFPRSHDNVEAAVAGQIREGEGAGLDGAVEHIRGPEGAVPVAGIHGDLRVAGRAHHEVEVAVACEEAGGPLAGAGFAARDRAAQGEGSGARRGRGPEAKAVRPEQRHPPGALDPGAERDGHPLAGGECPCGVVDERVGAAAADRAVEGAALRPRHLDAVGQAGEGRDRGAERQADVAGWGDAWGV